MTQWGLDTIFNPAKRHMDEEKRRLQSTREEVGDSSGGKRIDLESGKVRIERAEPGETDETDSAVRTGTDSAAPAHEPDATESASRRRARLRRDAQRAAKGTTRPTRPASPSDDTDD
jgi:hypothetical protein